MWWMTLALAAPEVTLEQIMADPDWIARSPERPGFADDGRTVRYQRKRAGSVLRDWFEVPVRGGDPVPLDEGDVLPPGGTWRRDGRARATVHEGDVWLVDRGRVRRLTHTPGVEGGLTWLADGRLAWQLDHHWTVYEDGIVATPAVVRVGDDPAVSEDDRLTEDQLRLFPSLATHRTDEQTRRSAREGRAQEDQVPQTLWVGKERQLERTALSPDAEHLLVVHHAPRPEAPDHLAHFVREDGYVEVEDIRPKVGTAPYPPHTVEVFDLGLGRRFVVPLDALEDIAVDPLAELRAAADQPALAGPRDVVLVNHAFSADGQRLAFSLESLDHKDRWLVEWDLDAHVLHPVHHEHDEAWVSWKRSDLGYGDGHQLWFTTEATGHAHLRVRDEDGEQRVLTSGDWELRATFADRSGRWVYFEANPDEPVTWELYRVSLETGEREQLTQLGGVNEGQLSPDEKSLLVTHSMTLDPPELYLQPLRSGAAARQLTFTIEPAYQDLPWVEPGVLPIPTEAGPVWSKVYVPDGPVPEGGRPLVVFVHGAGYTQNSHRGWPYYFREGLFHTLLVERGFVVLDMDYRGSEGYGRDWRTAIHRRMGHPELEDLAAGVRWATEQHGVDPARVGLYGGSYGGFLTFMALFRQPEVWAAGAALRPVTDWRHYNEWYAGSILGDPALDPEAYRVSSPIEHAEGLADPLLICHGMVDPNVPFQDSVRLSQRLIELGKTDWEMAVYPVEPHGFVEPSSWLDEYRRILALFEEHLR